MSNVRAALTPNSFYPHDTNHRSQNAQSERIRRPSIMKNILVPIDFSDATSGVVEAAASLAREIGAQIILLHAMRPVFVTPHYSPDIAHLKIPPELEVAEQLIDWEMKLKRSGLAVSAVQLYGEPCTSIQAECERRHADFIVVGSHGHGAIYELLMGSTATSLLRNAPCPVLVVPFQKGKDAALCRTEQPLVGEPSLISRLLQRTN